MLNRLNIYCKNQCGYYYYFVRNKFIIQEIVYNRSTRSIDLMCVEIISLPDFVHYNLF